MTIVRDDDTGSRRRTFGKDAVAAAIFSALLLVAPARAGNFVPAYERTADDPSFRTRLEHAARQATNILAGWSRRAKAVFNTANHAPAEQVNLAAAGNAGRAGLLAGVAASIDTSGPTDAAPAQPQPDETAAAATGPGRLEASVTLVSDGADQIRLVKDKSAIVRTNMPIERADIDPSGAEIASVAIRSPREILVTGKAVGVTQLFLWTQDGQQKLFDVVVDVDIPMLNSAIARMAPLAQVQARMMAGTLVLTGRVPDALAAQRIEALAKIVHPRVVNHLNVGGLQQTLLRCTVAEVNREAVRQLSMNWSIGGSDWSRDFFFANNLGNLNPTVFGDSGVPNVLLSNDLGGQITYGRLGTVNGPATNVTFGFPRAEFQMFLQAMRDNRLFRILAEPNVVATNGQTASFLSGGEFPIAVAQGGAVAGAISIEFKQFGILLTFAPTVLENGVIRMRVLAEVSDLVPGTSGVAGGLPVFSLSSRRVESTVEVADGQTFAIGGLLSDRVQALSSKLPALGDIPVLGALFSSVQYQRNETELVILVSPELVEPLDPHQVPPVPGQEMTDPTDYELFAMQRLEGKPRYTQDDEVVPRHQYPPRVRPTPEEAAVTGALMLHGPLGQSDYEEM